MIGILTNDFELFLKRNKSILNDLNENLNLLKEKYSALISNFQSEDLKFFIDKMNFEFSQLNKVLLKASSYQESLTSVYNGYKDQYVRVVSDSQKLIS